MSDAPLVILPGLMCDSRLFAGQLVAFPDAICIDGFYGGADRIGHMADYALARMPARCALLGHSMGARVALEVCRRAPARIARLALADSGLHPVASGERDKRYALRDLGRASGFAALVDAWLPPMLAPSQRADPALYERLRAMCLDAGQSIFEAQIEALLHRPDGRATFAAVACPVSLIVGELDQWSPVAQHRAMAAQRPDTSLSIVAGAGHMAPAECPDEFNAAIRRWLRA